MKLDEISLSLFKQKEDEPTKTISKVDPQVPTRLTNQIKDIKGSQDYDLHDEAFDAVDKAIAPYKEGDDGQEIPPSNYDRISHELSDEGVRHVLDRVSSTHYGAGRLEKLEKELDDISDRINIH